MLIRNATFLILLMSVLPFGCESLSKQDSNTFQHAQLVIQEARITAQDVESYLIADGQQDRADKVAEVVVILQGLEDALGDPDNPVEWQTWGDKLRLAWNVAYPFIPERYQLFSSLIAKRVDRILLMAEQRGDTHDDGNNE